MNNLKKDSDLLLWPDVKINLKQIKMLKEFNFNPFLARITEILISNNEYKEEIDLVGFIKVMYVFTN